MPINTELLIQVRDRILAEPEHFDMALFFNNSPCGTAACIGGWAVHLSEKTPLPELCAQYDSNTEESFRFYPDTMKALGLSEDEADRLFYTFNWPEKARLKYEQTSGAARAQVAADRIDHFIQTNGAE